MKYSRMNLVMTVIGFGLSIMFIVFVCTRLICARILYIASRRSSRSDLSHLERCFHGREHLTTANFPTKKYGELCLSSNESARCTVCLADYHLEDTICILPVCKHIFHETCIRIWLQQRSTCPVCGESLGECPRRKWFMKPLFSSALRSHPELQSVNGHHCCCTGDGSRHSSRSQEEGMAGPATREVSYRLERNGGESVGERSSSIKK